MAALALQPNVQQQDRDLRLGLLDFTMLEWGDEAIKQRAARIGARSLLRPAESLFVSEVTRRLERESLSA